jgi:transcription elongation factor S-II
MSVRKVDNPEEFRSKIRCKIDEVLHNEHNSTNLEKGIFNYALKEADLHKVVKKWDNRQFVQIYLDRLRSIMNNLSSEILAHISDGSLKPQVLAFMTHQELSPDKWSVLIDKKSKRDQQKFENNMAAATDTFTCRKCKSKKCTFYALQVRSSDEPMTIYVTCLECGQRWKTS